MTEISNSSVGITPTVDSFEEATVTPAPVDDMLHAYHWGVLRQGFSDLLERRVNSVSELENWIADVGSFFAEQFQAECIVEWKAEVSDDAIGLGELSAFIRENIDPLRQLAFNDVYLSLLSSPFVDYLDPAQYGPLLEHAKAQIDLFSGPGLDAYRREQWLDARLGAQLDEVYDAIPEEELEPNEEFIEMVEAAQQDPIRKDIDDTFSAITETRRARAAMVDMPVMEYLLRLEGFDDISANQWKRYHAGFSHSMIPVISELAQEMATRGDERGVVPFIEADAGGFTYSEAISRDGLLVMQKTGELLDRISPAYGDSFREMVSRNEVYLDEDPPESMPAGAFEFLVEGRPRIVAGVQGVFRDFSDLCHESGHAFYGLAAGAQPLMWHRVPRNDLNEMIATAFELIGSDHFDVVLDAEDALQARRELLEGYLLQMAEWFQISSFAVAMHENDIRTPEKRAEAWLQCVAEFAPYAQWDGIEELVADSYLVNEGVHVTPAYRARYMLGVPAAIDIWIAYQEQPEDTLERMQAVMEAGSSITPAKAYEMLGIENPISEGYFERLAARVGQLLDSVATP